MIDQTLLDEIWSQIKIASTYFSELKRICNPATEIRFATSRELAHLPILFCELHSGDSQQVVPVVTAWTILRYAARLLDDIEDQDTKLPKTAESTHLNFSTGLIFTASAVLNNLENYNIPSTTALAIRQRFYGELLKTCSGQHLDLTHQTPSLETCWQIAGEKSGSFLGLICWAGGRLACSNAQQLELYYQFGYILGILDQIKDDLADLWPAQTHYSNLHLNKWNLPTAYAFSVLPDAQKEQLITYLYATPASPSNEALALELIIHSGAGAYLAIQSMVYYQQGLDLLQQMALPEPLYHQLVSLLNKAKMPTGT